MKNLATLSIILTALSTSALHAQSSLHAVTGSSGDFATVNTTTLSISNPVELDFVAGDPQETYSGSAAHPVTGEIYTVMYGLQRRHILTKVDPSDGSFTAIGRIGVYNDPGPTASIAFGPAPNDYPATEYPLYLITGNAANVSGAVYLIDATTGEATNTEWSTSGVGGHALEYNPNDPGFLYHFYNTDEGGDGTAEIEKINLSNGALTPITLTGSYPRANGVAFLTDRFYILDNSNQALYTVTPTGTVASIGSVSGRFMNLSAFGSSIYALNRSTRELKEINPATGADLSSQSLGAAPDYSFIRGMAQDPTTGILYCYGAADFPNPGGIGNRIFQLDPLTGKISNSVPVDAHNFVSMTFTSDGTLYAVTGYDSNEENGLARARIATISTIDGTVTDTGWDVSPGLNPYSMMIAYNSDDGLIYYMNGDSSIILMRTINPTSGVVTDAGSFTRPIDFFNPSDMAYNPADGLFYLADANKFFTLSTGGIITEVGDVDTTPMASSTSLKVEYLRDLKVTDFSKASNTASISFESVLNREYGLYSSSNLTDWDPVVGFESIESSPPINTETNLPLPSADTGFFRLGPPVDE